MTAHYKVNRDAANMMGSIDDAKVVVTQDLLDSKVLGVLIHFVTIVSCNSLMSRLAITV